MSKDQNFKKALLKIEESKEFKEIDDNISAIFYTLYLRCKRLYYAMITLKDCEDKNVSYTEILPLLRVFIEGYFHICYVMSEKDTEKVKEGYEKLSYFSGKSIAGKLNRSKMLGEDGKDFVSSFDLGYKLPKKYEFLNVPEELAKRTGQEELYRKHYSILNTFIHFNPATYVNYGKFDENKFVFNSENEADNQITIELLNKITYLFIAKIVVFLGNEELDEEITDILADNLKSILG